MAGLLPFHKTESMVSEDFNNYIENGLYIVHGISNILNSPNIDLYGIMLVVRSTFCSMQIIFSSEKVFFRRSVYGEPNNYNNVGWLEL